MNKRHLLLATLALAATAATGNAQNTPWPTSGNVGIGTTSPSDKLHVVGRVQIDSDTADGFIQTKADNSHIRFGRSNGAIGNLVGYRPDVSPGNFVFYTYSGDWMFWNGNVGIGATLPKAKLHVGQSNQEIRFDYNGTDSYYGSLRWAGLQLGNNGENRIVAGRTQAGGLLDFYVNNTNEGADYLQAPNGILAVRMASNGNVGIGTTSPTEKLSVNGRIRAKEVIVDTGWSDYVFAKDYKLAPLSEVEQHIEQQGHLPGVPSAQEVADKGVSVGDMQAILLAKIEELTLHQIALEKLVKAQAAEIEILKDKTTDK